MVEVSRRVRRRPTGDDRINRGIEGACGRVETREAVTAVTTPPLFYFMNDAALLARLARNAPRARREAATRSPATPAPISPDLS